MRSWMFTHLFIQHTLNIGFVLDTILATGYKAGSQPDKELTCLTLTSSG